MDVVLRPAVATDVPFLTEMLTAAAFWRPGAPHSAVHEVLRRPELAHYIAGWERPGDMGIVAEAEGPVGAAWLRLFPAADPGYGFVDVTTPELAMGVKRDWRGRGVGAKLLEALIIAAREAHLPALSLSVEADNYARRLYERFGFRQVEGGEGSMTMLLKL